MHRSPVAPRRPRPLQFFSSFSTSPPATTPVCPSSCPSFPRSTLAFILPHRQSRGWALLPPTPSPARALFPPQPLCRSSVCLELGRVSFPLPLLLASSRHPRSTPNAACVHPHHPPPHALHTHLPTFTRSRSAIPPPPPPPQSAGAPPSATAPSCRTPPPLNAFEPSYHHTYARFLTSPLFSSSRVARLPPLPDLSLSLSTSSALSPSFHSTLSPPSLAHAHPLPRVLSRSFSLSLAHTLSLSLATTATHLPPLLP